MAKSPEEMAQSMIDNLPEKTGRSLDDWLVMTVEGAPEKHGEIVKWLKSEHGMTHGYANLVALKTREARDGGPADDDLVGAQYSAAKAGLRPIYDRLLEAVEALGPDVEIAPKKTYVSLRRSRQFGLVQPSTKTRVDLGIQLKGEEPGERLEASGSFNAMVSHRVRLSDPSEVDDEVVGWLRAAYERA